MKMWITYPGKGPHDLQPFLVPCSRSRRGLYRLLRARNPIWVVRGIECLCGAVGGVKVVRSRSGDSAWARCEQCSRQIRLYSFANVPWKRKATILKCAKCRSVCFEVAVGLEYPSVFAERGSDAATAWAAEGVNDDSVCWTSIAGKCIACGLTQLLDEAEGD